MERFLPDDGPCSNHYMTSITIREPIDRILSHYNHLAKLCISSLCTNMYYPPSLGTPNETKKYNVSLMAANFDIVTDNFYTRILNGKDAYTLPFGKINTSRTLLQDRAVQVLREIDWILVMGSSRKSKKSPLVLNNSSYGDAAGRNLMVLSQGMGFKNSILETVRRANQKFTGIFTDDDWDWLHKLNQLDYALWVEAQKLHDLDIVSLQKLEQFASGIMHPINQSSNVSDRTCCGKMCISIID